MKILAILGMSIRWPGINFQILRQFRTTASIVARFWVFWWKITMRKGLPFEARIPNATTLETLRDAD